MHWLKTWKPEGVPDKTANRESNKPAAQKRAAKQESRLEQQVRGLGCTVCMEQHARQAQTFMILGHAPTLSGSNKQRHTGVS